MHYNKYIHLDTCNMSYWLPKLIYRLTWQDPTSTPVEIDKNRNHTVTDSKVDCGNLIMINPLLSIMRPAHIND